MTTGETRQEPHGEAPRLTEEQLIQDVDGSSFIVDASEPGLLTAVSSLQTVVSGGQDENRVQDVVPMTMSATLDSEAHGVESDPQAASRGSRKRTVSGRDQSDDSSARERSKRRRKPNNRE